MPPPSQPSQPTVAADDIGKLSLTESAELYLKQQEWVTQGHLYDEKEFIDLLFTFFTSKKRVPTHNASHLDYTYSVSHIVGYRSYLSRLIVHFLQSSLYEPYHAHILSMLLYAGADEGPVVTDFLADDDAILRILVATKPMLFFHEDAIVVRVKKIWQVVFQAAATKPTSNVYRKMMLLRSEGDDRSEFDHILEGMMVPDLPTELAMDARKWSDKDGNQKKDFQSTFLEFYKMKKEMFTKTQAAIRFNKTVVNNNMAALQQQLSMPSIDKLKTESEQDREQQHQWRRLVKRVAHERGLWPVHDHGVIKWELDSTEGPNRMRIRLKRVESHPSAPFVPATVAAEIQETPEFLSPDVLKAHYKQQQTEHMSMTDMRSYLTFNLKPGERVLAHYHVSRITPFAQQSGELLIVENNMYFVDERTIQGSSSSLTSRSGRIRTPLVGNKPKQIMFPYEEISEVHKRRHLLKNNALEIFLVNGKTMLLAFEKAIDRDAVYTKIMDMELPDRINYQTEMQGTILKMSITKKWQKGLISNFEYLMHLNTLSGRSFNDLTQYPIFPFILKDKDEYDLENPENFRDISKPMGAQDPNRLKKFLEKFQQLIDMHETPYHYGSHYSNVGSVLHFLIRIEPFSGGFLDFQGGRFDVPDRAFHSINQSWRLSSSISSSDVKELIPEFYILPEFLCNKNRFDFGKKQDGDRVDDVILPKWASDNPRLFIQMHRAALESRYVSENLHNWIDLIFGAKQQGEAAAKSFNVFHPFTYEGAVDIDKIDDALMREATIAQISSYGQTPKQLFKEKHPPKNYRKLIQVLADCVFTHPDQLQPYQIGAGAPVGSIVFVNELPASLPPKRVFLFPDTFKYISWGHWDQTLRICAMDTNKVITTIDVLHDDDILCGDMTRNGRLLVTGGTSCVVKVWRRPNKSNREKADTLVLANCLCGHSDQVVALFVSQEWSIIATGSADKTCIIWDLNRLSYVRSLSKHEGPVNAVTVSPTSGQIVTACTGGPKGSVIRLWSINGDEHAAVTSPEKVTGAIFTFGLEGVVQNLVITGHENGTIKLYSAWDLTLVATYSGSHHHPISALALSKDSIQLISGDTSGALFCWSWKKPRENYIGIRI